MSDMTKSDPRGQPSEGHVHVVPLRVLIGVWAALIVLTWITVSATNFDLGNGNIVLALLIAVAKSAIVALFFMHLIYDKPFNAVIFISATLFVMLFISFVLIDTKENKADMIPGYAPTIEEAQAGEGAG